MKMCLQRRSETDPFNIIMQSASVNEQHTSMTATPDLAATLAIDSNEHGSQESETQNT